MLEDYPLRELACWLQVASEGEGEGEGEEDVIYDRACPFFSRLPPCEKADCPASSAHDQPAIKCFKTAPVDCPVLLPALEAAPQGAASVPTEVSPLGCNTSTLDAPE